MAHTHTVRYLYLKGTSPLEDLDADENDIKTDWSRPAVRILGVRQLGRENNYNFIFTNLELKFGFPFYNGCWQTKCNVWLNKDNQLDATITVY